MTLSPVWPHHHEQRRDPETKETSEVNPTALRMTKTPQSFGHSECNRVKLRTNYELISLSPQNVHVRWVFEHVVIPHKNSPSETVL